MPQEYCPKGNKPATMVAQKKLTCFYLALCMGIVFLLLLNRASGSAHSIQSAPSSQALSDSATLKTVQVVFRHGARTPLNTMYWPDIEWTNCPKKYQGVNLHLQDSHGSATAPPILDEDSPPLPGGKCTFGELTDEGYQMALDLGKALRQRYIEQLGALPETYQEEAVYARTTCIRRTVATLRGVLTGMYPDTVQSIPVNASSEDWEFMYGKNTTCERVGVLLDNLREQVLIKESSDKHMLELQKEVQEALRLPPSPIAWTKLYDTLTAIQGAGKPPVPGLTASLEKAIYNQATWHERSIAAPAPGSCLLTAKECVNAITYSVGPLLWHLIENMESHVSCHSASHGQEGEEDLSESLRALKETEVEVDGSHVDFGVLGDLEASADRDLADVLAHTGRKEEPGIRRSGAHHSLHLRHCSHKLFLFSGHDTTLLPMFAALQQLINDWPPYASHFVFELWQDPERGADGSEDSYVVRVLFNEEVLQFPSLGSLVPLKDLKRILMEYAIDELGHHKGCKMET